LKDFAKHSFEQVSFNSLFDKFDSLIFKLQSGHATLEVAQELSIINTVMLKREGRTIFFMICNVFSFYAIRRFR